MGCTMYRNLAFGEIQGHDSMNSIEQSIVKTLCYADIFDYSLEKKQIHQFLISKSKHRTGDVSDVVDKLIQERLIEAQNGYIVLTGRLRLTKKRLSRKKHSKLKIGKAEIVGKNLAYIPWVEGVFITGALAMDSAGKDDDIDFLIITSENRLWITRMFVTLILALKGVRRKPGSKDNRNLICANMYLDRSALKVPRSKRNLYTAHEVAQAKPLIDKESIYQEFLWQNRWINEYLPNVIIVDSRRKRKLNEGVKYKVFNMLENLAYQLQKRYMAKRITREHVTPHVAFFHPNNTADWVMKRYNQLVEKYI